MIEFLSSWAKGLGLAIVIVSILEMVLPNNKTKKYIRMVMGVYILFAIISPFIQNKDIFDWNQIDFEQYASTQTSTTVNQTSMDERIKDLYIEELEKDITKKIKEKGFEVSKCKVNAEIGEKEEESKITKIRIVIQKSEKQEEVKQEEGEENKIENKVITEIQKIKPIDTKIEGKEKEKEEKKEEKQEIKVSKVDIQNIKKFLMEEYGVNEKCLEIN